MMKCNMGRLRAHLDQALTAADEMAMQEHLASCPSCRQELAILERRRQATAQHLGALEPAPGEIPATAGALRVFRSTTLAGSHERNLSMILRDFFAGPRRIAVAAATVAVCALLLLTLAPVRQAAADFLSIFRVRKFAVIPLDPAQAARMESLADTLDQDAFGKQTVLRKEGEPQAVSDAAEASTMAGFAVRVPAALPTGARQRGFSVQAGPALRFEANRATLQALLDAMGVQGAGLPEAESLTFEVDVPALVTQEWVIDGGNISFIQVPDPQATYPPGVDPAVLGEIGFQLIGMAPEDARRMAQSIDWTSTVVIPLPTDAGRSREVTVDGASGLLLEETGSGSYERRSRVLMWERDGILYDLEGHGVDSELLLQLADSLR